VPVIAKWRMVWELADHQRSRAERFAESVMTAVVWWCSPDFFGPGPCASVFKRKRTDALSFDLARHYCRGWPSSSPRPEPAMIDAIRQGGLSSGLSPELPGNIRKPPELFFAQLRRVSAGGCRLTGIVSNWRVSGELL